jgi:hypothetical protein
MGLFWKSNLSSLASQQRYMMGVHFYLKRDAGFLGSPMFSNG